MSALHRHIQMQQHRASRLLCVMQAISLLDNEWGGEARNHTARNSLVGLTEIALELADQVYCDLDSVNLPKADAA